jgi:hypothetical protein
MTPQEAPTHRHLPPLVADADSSRDLSPFSLDPETVLGAVNGQQVPRRRVPGVLIGLGLAAVVVLAALDALLIAWSAMWRPY